MKSKIFIIVGLVLVLISLYFFCKSITRIYDMNFLTFYSQISVLVLMFFTLIFASEQISGIRKIEDDKVSVAIESLMEEMEYNKGLLEEYIDHSERGANIKPKNGKTSWEWNKPRQGAYERYLIFVCKDDMAFAREITVLYDKLESCKVIIETIQHFVAANLLESKCITGGYEAFTSEISRHNQQLYSVSKEAVKLIPGLIKRLVPLRLYSR